MSLPRRGVSARSLRCALVNLHFVNKETRRWTIEVAEPMDTFGKALMEALPRPMLDSTNVVDVVELRFVGPVYASALREAPRTWLGTWMKHAVNHGRDMRIVFRGVAAEQVELKWQRGELRGWHVKMVQYARGPVTTESSARGTMVLHANVS